MNAMLHAWLRRHPFFGRPVAALAGVQALTLSAVWAAPRAAASTNAAVLNWTGLTDSYGVPIGDYCLALASVPEQITQAGPGLGWDPGSWAQWSLHAIAVVAANLTTAHILTAEAGCFIGVIAVALWVMKVTVSAYWLTVVGALARAITGGAVHAVAALGVLLAVIPIGVFAGVLAVRRGEAGRGATMILTALGMPALSVAVFADPAGEMYGPRGLLAFGRRIGFSVAEAARPGGVLPGAEMGGQVQSLTASLITHTVREPLQLWNFGHVVDRVGGCGPAWSAAVRSGVSDAPIHAMGRCGDRAALAYAQHLDGTNIWVGLVFVAAALLLGVFMAMSGWAVLRVSVQAIWTTAILLPALWLAAVPGAARRRAMDVVWRFLRHGIEVTVYIVLVSVIGLAVESLVTQPLPAELGGTNPFAHVLMMGVVSYAAFSLLRHVRADLTGPAQGAGLLGRVGDVALGMGMRAAVGGVGAAAAGGLRGVRAQSGSRGQTPWEQIDAAAAAGAPSEVLGAPRPGFEPVSASVSGSSETASAGVDAVTRPPRSLSNAADPGRGRAANPLTGAEGSRSSGSGATTAQQSPLPDIENGLPFGPIQQPAALEPITPAAGTGREVEIPLPPEPAPLDDEPPPDGEDGPVPATVDPITGC